ncbi:MAG: Plug domain-containing protein [Parabacteroides merdae]
MWISTTSNPPLRAETDGHTGSVLSSLVLVDGMSVLSSGNGVINWNIVLLENTEQVEVMKGASSVLYGSSALNGVDQHPHETAGGLTPTTSARAYMSGIHDHPVHDEYEGADVSHARRIGNPGCIGRTQPVFR